MDVYEQLSEPLALATFAATLLLPVLVGFLARRRARTESDFFVGGRAMNRVVVALSAVSSGRSSWLVLGVSGMAFLRGASALWAVAGYTLVEALQFLWIGRRLRAEAQAADAVTLFDWFAARFDGDGVAVRVTGAAITVVFLTAYVAAQLLGGAKTLAAALGLPHLVALAAAALLILVYMLLGGYVAVAWNDVVRALIMLLGLLVLPAAALARIGGPAALRSGLAAIDPGLVDPFALSAGALIGFLGIGLGSPGQPHILVRYISIDDPRNLVVSAAWGTAFNVLLGAGAVAVGLVGRVLVGDAAALPGGDQEMVYLVLAADLFGPLLYGLLVGGVFAAILSTADSQLLVVASTVVRDLWEKALRRGEALDERAKLRVSRIALLVSAG
ncbi:MAG: sodium/proline symporter, partial [Acidobacteria bacterium]